MNEPENPYDPAGPEQPTYFVFRETDHGAPAILELWADEMERRHISTPNRIASARDCAAAMRKKLPDPLNPPPDYSFTLDDGEVLHSPIPIIEETDRPPRSPKE